MSDDESEVMEEEVEEAPEEDAYYHPEVLPQRVEYHHLEEEDSEQDQMPPEDEIYVTMKLVRADLYMGPEYQAWTMINGANWKKVGYPRESVLEGGRLLNNWIRDLANNTQQNIHATGPLLVVDQEGRLVRTLPVLRGPL